MIILCALATVGIIWLLSITIICIWMYSLVSGEWYIMGAGDGEWENNGGTLEYVEGNEREGIWKMAEWDRHHYPMCMYDYTNGMTLHCVQP